MQALSPHGLQRSHGDLRILGQNLFLVVGLAVQDPFCLRVVVQLERVLADAALEAHFVVDSASGFHPLGSVHRLAAIVTLLGLRSLERHDCCE